MGDGWLVDSPEAAPTVLVIREGLRGSLTALLLSFRRHNFLFDLNCMQDAFGNGFLGIYLDLMIFFHLFHRGAPVYTLLLLFFLETGDGGAALFDTEDLQDGQHHLFLLCLC